MLGEESEFCLFGNFRSGNSNSLNGCTIAGRSVDLKVGRRLHLTVYILLSAVGLATIILAVNEVTVDAFDRMGSNYWLAYSAIISGIALLLFVLRGRQERK